MSTESKKPGASCDNAGIPGHHNEDVTPASLLLQIEPELGAFFPRHVLDEQARNLAERLLSAGRLERQAGLES